MSLEIFSTTALLYEKSREKASNRRMTLKITGGD